MASPAFCLSRATTLLIPYMFLATLLLPASLSSGTEPTHTFCSGRSRTSSPAVTVREVEQFLGAVSAGAYSSFHRSYNASLYIDAENRTMYAVAQCRPDVPTSDCTACLAASSRYLTADAASCADSAVWHDRCFLRYSERDTSRFREDELAATVFNSRGRPARHGRAAVTGLLAAVMDRLCRSMQRRRLLGSRQAADGVTWGWGAASSSAGQVYGVARCAPGIARADCGRCLRGALAVAEKDYNGSAGMQVLRLSCTARYESYRFYGESSITFHGGISADTFGSPSAAPAHAVAIPSPGNRRTNTTTSISSPNGPKSAIPPVAHGVPAGTDNTVPSTRPPPAAPPEGQALLRLPLISSTAAVAGSGTDKPTLTFCSGGVSPYFTSSPVVSDGEFAHFLDSLLAGAYGNCSNVVDMSYNLSSNLGENRTLHGVAQCRPDVPVSECAACLAASEQSIAAAACTATAVWYDACFLRYSDDDTSRFREKEYTASVFNASRVLYGHAGKAVVTGLLAAVINSTVNTHTYSIGTGTAVGLVYNLARCIPGIARADCARCLRGALAVVEREYNGSAGMQVLRLGCMARYESYPFYNASLLGGMGVVIDGIGSNVTIGPNRRASPPPAAHPMPSPPRAAHAAAPSGGRGAGLPPPSPAQAQTRSHRMTRKTLILLMVLIATGTGVAVGTVGTILLFFWSHRKRRQNRRDVVANGIPGENVYFQGEEHINAEEDEHEEISASCQRYSYKILEVATCHFSNSNKLGSGGFGTVYKGTLENGEEVAVKRLKDSKRSLAELEREVSIVAKLRHENLVRFLGYCFEDEGRLLVYEYLPNNSLDKFWNKGYFQCQKLEWETWFSIIKGVARGLQFLHNKGVIHRDLKPHNVLLDEHLNPKIADFDLVRVYNKDRTHESTEKVAGTFGYMAPECTSGRKFQLSIKSDVYSYGVLVLEIITGRKIHTFEGHNSEGLVEYVWQHWTERRVRDVVDSDLDVEAGEQGQRQALRCVHVALLCVQSDRSRRPTMDEVIAMIGSHQDSELQEPSLPGYLHHPKPAPGRVLRPLPCFGRN